MIWSKSKIHMIFDDVIFEKVTNIFFRKSFNMVSGRYSILFFVHAYSLLQFRPSTLWSRFKIDTLISWWFFEKISPIIDFSGRKLVSITLYSVFVCACLIITIRNNFLNFKTFCETSIFTFLQQFDGEAFDKHFLLFPGRK